MHLRFVCFLLVIAGSPSVFAAAPPAPIDPVQVRTLLRKLDHDDFHVRHRADLALRRLGKPTLPLLREEHERSRSFEVRWRIGRMIADLTFDERVPGLVRLLGDRDPATRDRAAWALRQAGTPIVPLLQQELRRGLPLEQRTRMEKILSDLGTTPH